MYVYICKYIYDAYIHLYKCVINTNFMSTDDPFLLNKKDSQGAISNI